MFTKNKAIFKKMNSEIDFSSKCNYDEFATKMPFVCTILQPFQLKPFNTATEIQAKKDLTGTSA